MYGKVMKSGYFILQLSGIDVRYADVYGNFNIQISLQKALSKNIQMAFIQEQKLQKH